MTNTTTAREPGAITAVAVAVDGTTPRVVTLDPGDLAAFQRYVDGYIEGITITVAGHTTRLYLNEDGKGRHLDGDPAMANNDLATHLADRFLHAGDWIVGPVLLVGGEPDDDGNDTSIHPDVIAYLAELLSVPLAA